MILTFSEPKFEKLILERRKGTTFREDKYNRFYVGVKVELWIHDLEEVKNPHHIKDDIICDIQFVEFIPTNKILRLFNKDWQHRERTLSAKRHWQKAELDYIAERDGFENFEEMCNWFIKRGHNTTKPIRLKQLFFYDSFDDDIKELFYNEYK